MNFTKPRGNHMFIKTFTFEISHVITAGFKPVLVYDSELGI